MVPTEAVKEIYLFRGASPEDLAVVAAITERRDWLSGDVLYQAGEPADAMFHIEMGTIELAKPGAQVVFATIGSGQTIGEIGFFQRGNRAGTATAREQTRALRISYDKLTELLSARPQLALVVYRNAAAFLAGHFRQLALERDQRYL